MSGPQPEPTLVVTEVFHSIQGESSWIGLPCVFIRLTGCPLRCRWCDTAYAFAGGRRMGLAAVIAQAASFGCRLIEVTGGEPLAQPASLDLLRGLADAGYEVLLETSGALPIDEVDPRVRIIMDIKCPGSGESHRNLWSNLDRLRAGDEIKVVIASADDYVWACGVLRDHDLLRRHPVIFSPVWGAVDPATMAGWILRDGLEVRLQVQLHKVLFGPEVRGV